MNGYRCPLGGLQPTKQDPEEIKRDGWQEQGILVVSEDDHRLDWVQRQFVKQIGEKLYGAKRVRNR
ncbi:MAG: hypothetical protein ACYC0P_06835 [Thiobacillus sp.]